MYKRQLVRTSTLLCFSSSKTTDSDQTLKGRKRIPLTDPEDVYKRQLLGHSDVSTTMNVYAHSTRKAKREPAKLLDKVAGND